MPNFARGRKREISVTRAEGSPLRVPQTLLPVPFAPLAREQQTGFPLVPTFQVHHEELEAL